MSFLTQNILLAALFVGITIVFFSFRGPQTTRQSDQLVAGVLGLCPPYAEQDKDGGLKGFSIDVFEAVASKLKKPLRIRLITAGPFESWINDELVDFIGPALAIRPERLKQMAMVHVYGEPHADFLALFRAEDRFANIQPIEELQKIATKKAIGTTIGSSFRSLLEENNIHNIQMFNDEKELLVKLKNGDIDAAVIGPRGSEYLAKQDSGVKTVKITLDKPWGLGAGIGIKKGRKELIEKLQKVVTELKQEGVIKELQVKWFGDCDKKY